MFSRLKSVYRLTPELRRCLTTSNARLAGGDHAVAYRLPPPPAPKINYTIAEFMGGFMWWWILWHLWTEPGHIFGEWDMPDPNKWTDEELGIPPDDVD